MHKHRAGLCVVVGSFSGEVMKGYVGPDVTPTPPPPSPYSFDLNSQDACISEFFITVVLGRLTSG